MNSNEIFFSVIIPAYNAENYISRSIRSVVDASQANGSYECIIVDNGSTDKTKEICIGLKKQYQEINFLSTEIKGVSHARNLAIDVSRGKFILFLDADDYFLPDWNKVLFNAFKYNKADLYIFNFMKIFEDGSCNAICYNLPAKAGKQELDKLFMTTTAMYPCWSRMYSKNMIIKHSLRFDESMSAGEDFVFSLNYWEQCKTAAYIREKFLVKEEHNDSVMHQLSIKKCLEVENRMYRVKKDYLERNHCMELKNEMLVLHFKGLTNLFLQVVIRIPKNQWKSCVDEIINHFHTKLIMNEVDPHALSGGKRFEYVLLCKNKFVIDYFRLKSKFLKLKKKDS